MISYFDFVAVLAALVAVGFAYFKWAYQYWTRRDVPSFGATAPFGNFEPPYKRTKSIGIAVKEVYDKAKNKGWKHVGIYSFAKPIYVVIDLDYLKNIMAKDFSHFVDRGFYFNEKDDPIGAHLFAIGGPKWRNLRTKLTPTFTSGKMKMMFPTLVECVEYLKEDMDAKVKNREPLDIKEILGCFTTDIIGSCAFGLECNAIKADDSPFRYYGKKSIGLSKRQIFEFVFANAFPAIARALHIRQISKDVSDFFTKIVNDTVKYREENGVVRKDFLQLLIELKNKEFEGGEEHTDGDGQKLTMDEVVAQCFIFFLAGFETSSTTMTFALYELARHRDVQDKVRAEIDAALKKHGGKMTYECIQDMKYMNQVIDETLRMYPPVPFVTRVCVKDYKLSGSDVVIEKDTRVFVPILGIHRDPEIYEDPEQFDPERFAEENKHGRHQYAHIPFGEGPRLCIGMRFGVMQTKMGLASLLKDYVFTVNSRTKEPIKMDIASFILSTDGGMWLNATRI